MKPGHRHITSLDTLRGLAALTVCLYHFTGKVLPSARIPALAAAFDWGGAGVMVFFVISGFVIPYVLHTGGYRLRDFGQFMGKRILRICPPSWIVVGLIIGQWGLYQVVYHSPHPYLSALTPQQVLYNLTYTAPFFRSPWINNVFWTLSIEFQYYLLMALCFPFLFRNKWTFCAGCLAVAALYYLPVHPTEFFFKWGVLFMMGGAALLYFLRHISGAFFGMLLAGLFAVGWLQAGPVAASFALGTALVIALVSFRSRIGAFLGRISYSLYLLHVCCAPVLEKALLPVLPVGTLAGKVLMQALCLLGTLAVSWLFYQVVERYFIRLSARWAATARAAAD